MSNMLNILTIVGVLVASFAGVSARPRDPASRATSSTFSLFAYGSNSQTEIGGFPIFYNRGYAYIADPAKVNYTGDYVVFTENTTDTTEWIANPLTVTNATWSESLFYVPIPAGPTGFYKEGVTNVSISDIITTGFTFYGTTAMLKISGQLYTQWYAVPTTIDGLWSVGWNATGSDDASEAELIAVRKVNPPNVSFPDGRSVEVDG